MDINAEELMRRYKLLDQEPVLEYSSLETEADNENPLSTLSTPSTITDTDLPSPLLLFTPELDKSFSFDLQDILDLSTEEKKAELTGTSSFHINNSNSHNSSIEGIETTEDSSFDPDSLLNKEKKNPQKFTLESAATRTHTKRRSKQNRRNEIHLKREQTKPKEMQQEAKEPHTYPRKKGFQNTQNNSTETNTPTSNPTTYGDTFCVHSTSSDSSLQPSVSTLFPTTTLTTHSSAAHTWICTTIYQIQQASILNHTG